MRAKSRYSTLIVLFLILAGCAGFNVKEEYSREEMLSWLPDDSELYLAVEKPGESELLRQIMDQDSRFAGFASVIEYTDSLYLGLNISERDGSVNLAASGNYPDSLYSLYFSASGDWERISRKPSIYRNPAGFSVSPGRNLLFASSSKMDELLYRKEAGSLSEIVNLLDRDNNLNNIDILINQPEVLTDRFIPGAGIVFPLKNALFHLTENSEGAVLDGYLAPEDPGMTSALARILHLFRSGVMILTRDSKQKTRLKEIVFEDAGDRVLIEGLYLDTETMLSYF